MEKKLVCSLYTMEPCMPGLSLFRVSHTRLRGPLSLSPLVTDPAASRPPGEREWGGLAHTEAPSWWCRPSAARAWSERMAGTAERDVLPRRRRTEKRCTSSLSPGGRDAAGSVTNSEREREATAQPFPRRTRCDQISDQR